MKELAVLVTLAGALVTGRVDPAAAAPPETINSIGVENEYADVVSQIGGKYVTVAAIETDPNTDPHSFEVSPKVAMRIAAAELIVKNGVGYDTWADKVISAAPNANRKVIDVQQLLDLPDSTPNPHLWYDPKTMPAVAKAIAGDLSVLQPAHTTYFETNLKRFNASLEPWIAAIAAFRAQYRKHTGRGYRTGRELYAGSRRRHDPHASNLQAALMNGTDPAPQDVTTQDQLLTGHKVKVFAVQSASHGYVDPDIS